MKFRVEAARAGQVVADRYLLQAPVGRGGMGRVWRAEHLRLKSLVAIKFLDPAIAEDSKMFNRFLREAQSAAAVRSAHVVQVFDCGLEGGTPYISMELLDGESLDARLIEQGTLTPAELNKIFGASDARARQRGAHVHWDATGHAGIHEPRAGAR